MKNLLYLILLGISLVSCQDDEAPTIAIHSPNDRQVYPSDRLLPIHITFYGAYDINSVRYSAGEAFSGTIETIDELAPSFLVVSDQISIFGVDPGEYNLTIEVTDDSGNINRSEQLFRVGE